MYIYIYIYIYKILYVQDVCVCYICLRWIYSCYNVQYVYLYFY